MGDDSEIERLFQEVLDEKDRFKIATSVDVICGKLRDVKFKQQCREAKNNHIETTESLLNIYSITFNEIMWKKIRQHMMQVLDCIEVSETEQR